MEGVVSLAEGVLDCGCEEEVERALRDGREVRRVGFVRLAGEGMDWSRDQMQVWRDGKARSRGGRREVVQFSTFLRWRDER